MSKTFTIGEAARAAGVNVETIRFYERQGLLKRPERPGDGGVRRYGEDAVRRVRFIKEAQKLGFSLREIDELLALQENPGADCADIKSRASAKLEDIRAKMASLARMDAELDRLVAACCGAGSLEHCAIMNSLLAAAAPRDVDPAGLARASFRVTRMKCQGCATSLKLLLDNTPGIVEARVSFRERLAEIRHDPERVRLPDIVKAIRDLGFDAKSI